MTITEFEAADASAFHGALLALWWDARGDWERAHEVAQKIEAGDSAWVHAFLHRKRGEAANAAYWYGRAGRPVGTGDLRAEWERMVGELLER